MTSANTDSLLLVGTCGRAHGVQGEVKVIPETDDPERLAALAQVYVGATPETAQPRAVEALRFQPTKRGLVALVRFDGIAGRDAADALRGQGVFADAADLPPLEEGEVFLHDLIGLAVVTEGGEAVGTVTDVLDGTAHPLLVVQRDGRPDALVPDVDEIVTTIDLDAEQITIAPPEGLLE
ncbi:MAG: ribosome maturation factor RimM [Bacteroidota bacterium]